MSFENLKLNSAILKALADTGYTEPTPIQAQAIPEIMAGHDLMACSQTGSGKTAAFILPVLNRLVSPSPAPGKGPRVLILTPTRELAQQVCDAASKYGKNLRFKIISVLGGMPYPVQNRLLSGHVDILVATPGRLIDHLERGRIDFSRLEVLILDEADRMLDMGFIDDVERIAQSTPKSRQTLLFSETLDGIVGNLASRLLKDPKKISISAPKDKHENIEQRMMFTDDVTHKNKILSHLLSDAEINQALVFTATKRDADGLADLLSAQGHSVAALHGDMSQRERNRTLASMRNGHLRILVATDVAARGLDVRGISHVINFDLPKFAEDYVHRIGRTGRGGSTGVAISFASNRDSQLLRRIERYTEQRIQLHTIEGLEPKYRLRSGPSAERSRGNAGTPHRAGRTFSGSHHSSYGSQTLNPYGKYNSGLHHTAPDSRHSHSGRKEGHGQWNGRPHHRDSTHGSSFGRSPGSGWQDAGMVQVRNGERGRTDHHDRKSKNERLHSGNRVNDSFRRRNNGNSR